MSFLPDDPPSGEPVIFDRPQSIGDLLTRSFQIYRARFAGLVGLAALFLVPYALISGLLAGQISASTETVMRSFQTGGPFPMGAAVSYMTSFFLIGFLGLVVNAAIAPALIYQIGEFLHGRAISLGQSLRGGLSRFWAYMGMSIVQGIVFILVAAVVIVIVVMLVMTMIAGADLASGKGPALGVVGFLLIFSLAVVLISIPWLFLAARWIAAMPALVLERRGPIESLGYSWRLTRGNTWRAIGLIVLLTILGIVLSLPIMFVRGILAVALSPGPSNLFVSSAIGTMATTFVQILWLPFTFVVYTLFYYDLRARKEEP